MTPPRRRKHDKTLPPGLYRNGNKFKARAWGNELAPVKRGDMAAKWILFDGPLSEATRQYYEWKSGGVTAPGEVFKLLEKHLKSSTFLTLSSATQRTEVNRVRRLQRVFGRMTARALRPQHFVKYLETQPPQGGKKDLKRFSVILNQWVATEIVDKNPIPDVLKAFAPPDNKRDRYVLDSEISRCIEICAGLDTQDTKKVQSYLELEWLIGRRVSNTRTIKRSDLTDAGIVIEETKTGKRVIVPWTDELRDTVERVKARHKPGFYLITNRDGGMVSEGSLNQAFMRVRKNHFRPAGVDDFQLRDIRAKYGTDIEETGRDGAANLNNSQKVFDANYRRKPKRIESLK